MTIVAIILAATLAGAVVAVVALLDRSHREQAAQWALERRELLTRIQRPEIVPVASPAPFVVPDPEPDEIGKVGTIDWLATDDALDEVGAVNP